MQRPASLRKLADMFALLEDTLMGDGRTWILDTPRPSVADIEAVWLLNFILEIPGTLPAAQFSAQVYPRVFAWVDRFRAALDDAQARNEGSSNNNVRTLSGEEAAAEIAQAAWHEDAGGGSGVDAQDFEAAALGLVKGDAVTVGPTDFGSSCRDGGALLSVSAHEVVVEAKAGSSSTVRIHAPRQQFSILKA